MAHKDHHSHHSTDQNVGRKLMMAAVATLVFVFAELATGVLANSLALVGDAVHNFTDSVALLLAWVAVQLERRPPTIEKSFGYQRAGILAAFINAGTLVGFTVFIFIEAVDRFRHPDPINDRAMLITAVVAVVLNTAISILLRREGERDVNIRSAVIHMLGDAISSAGIIAAALMIRFTGSPVWDPAVSILIGLLILWSSWGILKETVNLLLEGTPQGIDPEAVSRSLAAIDGVEGVHHLHIWAIAPSRPSLSCHLMVGDVPLRTTTPLLDEINGMLAEEYGIVHATVQFEFANCAPDDPYCVPWSAGERQRTL
jgi:cobalt-zinc-cadmium efflux system protein